MAVAWGCASRGPSVGRPLKFPAGTLAITNETHWLYLRDPASGTQRSVRRDPPPEYALRCFVLARTAKQFHAHADFAPERARPDEAAARRLVRQVVGRSPRSVSPSGRRVVIPGYPDLHWFSEAWPRVFQEECGGAWQSYVQRGHWRMILPFTRRSQEREAAALAAGVRAGRAPVVHLVDFPRLRMNHAVVFFEAVDAGPDIRFKAYDPNDPGTPIELVFHGSTGHFEMQPVAYFLGGKVSAYEVFCRGFR
jgi:hypothetical protein